MGSINRRNYYDQNEKSPKKCHCSFSPSVCVVNFVFVKYVLENFEISFYLQYLIILTSLFIGLITLRILKRFDLMGYYGLGIEVFLIIIYIALLGGLSRLVDLPWQLIWFLIIFPISTLFFMRALKLYSLDKKGESVTIRLLGAGNYANNKKNPLRFKFLLYFSSAFFFIVWITSLIFLFLLMG